MCGCKPTVGSNPTATATRSLASRRSWRGPGSPRTPPPPPTPADAGPSAGSKAADPAHPQAPRPPTGASAGFKAADPAHPQGRIAPTADGDSSLPRSVKVPPGVEGTAARGRGRGSAPAPGISRLSALAGGQPTSSASGMQVPRRPGPRSAQVGRPRPAWYNADPRPTRSTGPPASRHRAPGRPRPQGAAPPPAGSLAPRLEAAGTDLLGGEDLDPARARPQGGEGVPTGSRHRDSCASPADRLGDHLGVGVRGDDGLGADVVRPADVRRVEHGARPNESVLRQMPARASIEANGSGEFNGTRSSGTRRRTPCNRPRTPPRDGRAEDRDQREGVGGHDRPSRSRAAGAG